MSRLAQRFAQRRADRRVALTTFITVGDPTPSATVPALHALVRGGADILELGVPFSDPEAEGPSIQRSSARALRNGATLGGALDAAAAFRSADADTPLVLMGYLNPVLRMGCEAFASRAAAAGVDGVILVNLSLEEADVAQAALRCKAIDLIFLVAPTTSRERAARIAARASGFVYYVSLQGVTGARHLDVAAAARRIADLREVCDLPVQAGFGIRDAASARAVGQAADGIVVGSALVDAMGELATRPEAIPDALEARARALRQALDAA